MASDINLASVVVNLEVPWNPAVLEGQKRFALQVRFDAAVRADLESVGDLKIAGQTAYKLHRNRIHLKAGRSLQHRTDNPDYGDRDVNGGRQQKRR